MPRTTPLTVTVADLPEVRDLLATLTGLLRSGSAAAWAALAGPRPDQHLGDAALEDQLQSELDEALADWAGAAEASLAGLDDYVTQRREFSRRAHAIERSARDLIAVLVRPAPHGPPGSSVVTNAADFETWVSVARRALTLRDALERDT